MQKKSGCGCGKKSLQQKNQFLLNKIKDNTKLNIEQINQESYLEQSVNQLDNASQNLPTQDKPVSKKKTKYSIIYRLYQKKIL